MEKPNSEQTAPVTQPTTVEDVSGESTGEVSLGKFKDVNALLSAYSSLQAEFTKRCQKIKELESALTTVDKEEPPTETASEPHQPVEISEEEKQEFLKEYLHGVLGRKQKAVLLDGAGVGVKLPVSRPKTIAQAGMLAQQFLDK